VETSTSRLPAAERIVIRMPNWLGDAVMAIPAAAAVRAAYPTAHLAIAAIPAIAPMFAEHTAVAPQQLLVVDKQTELAALRNQGFDTILLMPNSFRSAWVAKRSGIPNRWGYSAGVRGPLLTRSVTPPPKEAHQSEYYSHLVRGLGIDVAALAPAIEPTPDTRARAAKRLEHLGRPLVGFAPGAAYGHAKRWPPERVAEVVTRLVRGRSAACLLVGAPSDREAGRAVESSLPPGVGVLNLIGRTDLRLLIGILAHCDAFVSNDSGGMHLAAAAGVPVTAIFGPTNERATAPIGNHDVILNPVFCRPCMLRECPIDHRCMKRISSEEVVRSVERRLDAAAGSRA
jgi:heptosyltransferase II